MATQTKRNTPKVIDTENLGELEAGRAMLIEYLNEAHATEGALVTTLGTHISITPRGSYRTTLERHLTETRQHARALERRIAELGGGSGLLGSAKGTVQTILGQALVLGKGPIDMLRGSGGEEKLLKNAKDEATTEMLEIATYDAIEQLALALGDEKTARMATRHRDQEERALRELREHIGKLTLATVKSRAGGEPSYDWETTGAAEAVKGVAEEAEKQVKKTARKTTRTAKKTTSTAKRTTSTAKTAAKSTAKRAERSAASTAERTSAKASDAAGTAQKRTQSAASGGEPPMAGYDELNASDIVTKLTELSQDELRSVNAYERANKSRDTVIDRVKALQESQPFSGYDDLTGREVAERVRDADEKTVNSVREYEGRHKRRVEVLEAAQRQISAKS